MPGQAAWVGLSGKWIFYPRRSEKTLSSSVISENVKLLAFILMMLGVNGLIFEQMAVLLLCPFLYPSGLSKI